MHACMYINKYNFIMHDFPTCTVVGSAFAGMFATIILFLGIVIAMLRIHITHKKSETYTDQVKGI